ADTRAWVSDGEIEDYRYYVTSGQVRVALVSQGGTVSNVGYTVTNVSNTAPSTTSGTLKTEATGQAWASPAQHIINSTGATTTVALSGVPVGQTIAGASCVDSTTGVDPWGAGGLPAANRPVLDGTSITIPANTFSPDWADLLCTFTISKPPSAAKSEFTLAPTDGAVGTAQVGAHVTGTVTVRDQTDGPLAGMTVQLASDAADVKLQNAGGDPITSCVTDGQGECQVFITSEVAGTYTNAVHATFQETAGGPWVEVGPSGVAAKKSPKTVKFTAGDKPVAAKSEFTINEDGPIIAGQDYTLTVAAYDGIGTANSGKGNLVPGATVQFSASPTADGAFSPANGQCTTTTTGVCSVTFTSTKAGPTFTLTAKVYDRQQNQWLEVAGAGDSAKASPKTRAFKAGSPDSDESSLSVDPDSLPVGGTADVTVTLRDEHGNAVSGLAAALNVSATAGATVSTTWTESPANSGVYVGTVVSTTPGTSTVQAAPTGATVSDTVVFLASTTASAGNSTLAVGPAGPIKAGEDYTLTATLYDGVGSANGGKGNPVSGAAVSFSVDPGQDFGSEGFSSPTCTSESNGACQVKFSSSKPGTFTFRAQVADRDQTGQPLAEVGSGPQSRVVIVADVAADKSSLTVADKGVVGETAAVTLTLKDEFGNPVTGWTDAQLATAVAPSGGVLSALAEDPAGSGVYTGTVTAPTAGVYTVSAQPSPLTQALTATTEFTWRKLPTDGTSVLTVAPNPARAGSSLVATLVVKGAAGQAVTGLSDVLTLASDGMSGIPDDPTESPDGTYTWNVDAVQAAGPYQAVATDGGAGVATANYTLTQVASAAKSSVAISDSGTGRQANDTDSYTVTVSLRDLTDVPITDGLANAADGKPKLSLVGPNNADHTIWDLAHAGAGVYTAQVRASAAASYTVSASYDRGLNTVALGSVQAQFSSPTPSSTHTSFTVSTGDQVVGVGQHTVTATFKNDQGQPVVVSADQLSGSKAVPEATVGAFAQVPNEPGVYRAPITATVAGSKTVEVQWTDGASTVAVQPAVAGDDKVMFVAGPAVAPSAT
ncbi:MAG: hypothetical protein LBS56_10110, partial [Propionibacteriaceae bacterium]|nr:hypothetical protein [Propionibacteriaceae bacterium]